MVCLERSFLSFSLPLPGAGPVDSQEKKTNFECPSLTFTFRNLDLVEKAFALLNGLVELGFSCKRILLGFLPSFSREGIT